MSREECVQGRALGDEVKRSRGAQMTQSLLGTIRTLAFTQKNGKLLEGFEQKNLT